MLDKRNPLDLLVEIAKKAVSNLTSQPLLFIILYFLLLLVAVLYRPEVIEQLKFIWLTVGVVALVADIVRVYIVRKTPKQELPQAAQEKPEQKNTTGEIEQKYLHELHTACQSLVLGGIDPSASDPRNTHMELRGVYVDLATTQLAINDNGKNSRNFFSEAIRVSALRVINEQQYVVLLGHPGSGKSTLINFVTLCLTGEKLNRSKHSGEWINQLKSYDAQWKHGALFPIRIRLHKVDSNDFDIQKWHHSYEPVLNMLIREFGESESSETRDWLTEKLSSGDVIVLFDGLDEILDTGTRSNVASSINAFVKQFSAPRYIVTCRSAVYPMREDDLTMPWYLSGFKVAVLDDFEDNQINQFIDSWYSELVRINRADAATIHSKTNELKGKIDSTPHIRKLAGKPLLLTVMVILFDHGGGLPEQKAKLYDQCFELLLWKWEVFRHGNLNPEKTKSSDILIQLGVSGIVRRTEVERALCRVVFDCYSKYGPRDSDSRNQSLFRGIKSIDFIKEFQEVFEAAGFSERDSLDKAKELVAYLRERSGVFIPTDEEILAPLHRSFQDYLVAKYICSQRKFTVFIVDLVFQQFEMWREVFTMAIGQKCLQDSYHEAIDAVTRLAALEMPDPVAKNNLLILVGESLREIGATSLNKDLAGKPLLSKTRRSLLELSQCTSPLGLFARIDVGFLLAELGDPRLEMKTVHGVKVVIPDLVLIPTSKFEMGSNKLETDSLEDEYSEVTKCSRQIVELHDFYISKYLVTEFEYELFVRDTGHHPPKHWVNARPKDATANLPVTNISWFDAVEYCNWLQKQMVSLGNLRENFVIRLPTEAEWEKAARWNPSLEKSYIYPWGDEWKEGACNNLDTGILRCSPIGIFPQNPFGLYDMAGNVAEWCNSALAEYPYSLSDMREAFFQPVHKMRAVKGGSWNSHRRFVRTAFRSGMVPDAVSGTFGFRVVAGSPLR